MEEKDIREFINQFDSSKISMNILSLDFVREFRDQININTFFNYLYGCYKIHFLLKNLTSQNLKSFDTFLFDYNKKMYLEFIKEYER